MSHRIVPSTKVDTLFNDNIDDLASSFCIAMQKALQEHEELRQIGRKGTLSHVYISFLLSGVLLKSPWLRVDLYDENELEDICECKADWDVPRIGSQLYQDVENLAMQSERIKDYEKEQTWLGEAELYCQGFERILPLVISRCPIVQTVDCMWHFGQYLGNTVVVRKKSENEIL